MWVCVYVRVCIRAKHFVNFDHMYISRILTFKHASLRNKFVLLIFLLSWDFMQQKLRLIGVGINDIT